MDSVQKNTVVELVNNWDGVNNEIFPFRPNSYEGSTFKKLEQHEWISNLPKFSELVMRNSFEKNDHTECSTTPMDMTTCIILKVATDKSMPNILKDFL